MDILYSKVFYFAHFISNIWKSKTRNMARWGQITRKWKNYKPISNQIKKKKTNKQLNTIIDFVELNGKTWDVRKKLRENMKKFVIYYLLFN